MRIVAIGLALVGCVELETPMMPLHREFARTHGVVAFDCDGGPVCSGLVSGGRKVTWECEFLTARCDWVNP